MPNATVPFKSWLLPVMQTSILVPMAVVWLRRRQFSAAVQRLSWYVYLSLATSIGAWLGAIYLHYNLGFLVAFNLGKIALFGMVYYQVLALPWARRLVAVATVVAVVGAATVMGYDGFLAMKMSRVAQCALLAGFALLYLEQSLGRTAPGPATHDPIWLLSAGQLLYSAGTVTVFSLESAHLLQYGSITYFIMALSGLAFNGLLTLAFWRARPTSPAPLPLQARQAIRLARA